MDVLLIMEQLNIRAFPIVNYLRVHQYFYLVLPLHCSNILGFRFICLAALLEDFLLWSLQNEPVLRNMLVQWFYATHLLTHQCFTWAGIRLASGHYRPLFSEDYFLEN